MDNQNQVPNQQQQCNHQPSNAQGQQRPSRPDNYLIWAILSTLLCCLPLGIVSIIYSSRVNSLYDSGDYLKAQEAANKAKKFAIWAAAIFAVGVLLYILLFVVLGVAEVSFQ